MRIRLILHALATISIVQTAFSQEDNPSATQVEIAPDGGMAWGYLLASTVP